MKFAVTVLLLAVWACVVHVGHAGEKRSGSDSQGTSLRPKRMVGGLLSPHVPWQAMVYLSDSLLLGGFAGGALISDRWVLTAGRNVFVKKTKGEIQGKAPVIPKVYLGINDRVQAVASNEYEVEKVVLHPHFQNRSDWDNDLALILLRQQVVVSNRVTPIPLPGRDHDLAGIINGSGAIAGWGFGALVAPSQSLKHLVLSIASHAECQAKFGGDPYAPRVDHNMFCTGPTRLDKNVCLGDAGGALAVRDAESGDVYAAGILSYDKSCNNHKHAVYMKLSSYVPWIHSVIRGDTEQSVAVRNQAMARMYSRQ